MRYVHHNKLPLLVLIGLCFWSCFSSDDLATTTLSIPQIIGVNIYDWSGRTAPYNRIPRRPIVEFQISKPIDDSNQPVMLVSGHLDNGLLTDLTRPPLNDHNKKRVIDSHISYQNDRVVLIPTHPLSKGSTLTALMAGWVRGKNGIKLSEENQPYTLLLTVSNQAKSGAQIDGSWPADNTSGVAPNLAFAAVHIDGNIREDIDGIWIENPKGLAVPATIKRRACKEIGWNAGVCITIIPKSILAPNSHYQIVVSRSVYDSTGAPLGTWSVDFYTSHRIDDEAPSFSPLSCAIDESKFDFGCALIDDQSLTFRIRANEPVRLKFASSEYQVSITAPRGEAQVILDNLNPDRNIRGELSIIDDAGNQSVFPVQLHTEADLEKLSIVEVLADPQGPEPQQEFIEILNYGKYPIDLEGFSISDQLDMIGDRIQQSNLVYPGARVLLVADRFSFEDPLDKNPPPGVSLVRIGTSLGQSGLSNAGEDLFLRNPRGKRISAAPGTIRPHTGVCLIRTSEDMRDGSKESFDLDPNGSCTPGY